MNRPHHSKSKPLSYFCSWLCPGQDTEDYSDFAAALKRHFSIIGAHLGNSIEALKCPAVYLKPSVRFSTVSWNEWISKKPKDDATIEDLLHYQKQLINYMNSYIEFTNSEHECFPCFGYHDMFELYDNAYFALIVTLYSVKLMYPGIITKTKPLSTEFSNMDYVDNLINSLLPILRCHPAILETFKIDPLQICYMVMFGTTNGVAIVDSCKIFVEGYNRNKANPLLSSTADRDIKNDPSYQHLKSSLDNLLEDAVGNIEPWFDNKPDYSSPDQQETQRSPSLLE